MRNWLLIVALVLGLLVELVWLQLPSASFDGVNSLDSDHVILDAIGADSALTRSGKPGSGFLPEPNLSHDDGVEGSRLNELIHAGTRSRTYASSIFGYALGVGGHQAGGLLRAEISPVPGRRAKRDRNADSGQSKIRR